jgi:hypothetical protein
LYGCGGDQNMHAAKDHAHTIHSRAELLEIADIGPDSHRGATCVLDFEFRGIELCLAARHQTYACARLRKTKREPLSNPPAGPGDQNALIFKCPQSSILRVRRKFRFRLSRRASPG